MGKATDTLNARVRLPASIPDEWEWLSLSACCRPTQWTTIPRSQLTANGFPVYGANGLIGSYAEYNHEQETIAIGCRGTCGIINRVPPKAYITGNAMALDDVDEAVVLQGYLFYALNYRRLTDAISGSAQPQITRKGLSRVRFPCPPLPEQRKVAAILSSVDDAIEKTQAVIDQVQVVKRGLMQELLTRGLPGRHTRFKQTKIGEIPEDWGLISLAESNATVTSGSRGWARYYSDEGALFLRITNLTRNTIRLELDDLKHVALPSGSAEGKRTRVRAGDLLISITADLGMVGVIPENFGEAYVNQHLALVRLPSNGVLPEFAGYFLTTQVARKRFLRLNDSGAKAGLNLSTIRKLTFPNPSREEQRSIVQMLSSTEDRIALEESKLVRFADLKSALMSALLTGELRVAPDTEAA